MREFIVKILNQMGYQEVSSPKEFCVVREKDKQILDSTMGHEYYKDALLGFSKRWSYRFVDELQCKELDLSQDLSLLKIKIGDRVTVDTDGEKIFSIYSNQQELKKHGGDVISIGYFGYAAPGDNVDMHVYIYQTPIATIQLLDTRYSFNGQYYELDSYQPKDIANVYMKLIEQSASKYIKKDMFFEAAFELISPIIRDSIIKRIIEWQKSLEGRVFLLEKDKENTQEKIDKLEKEVLDNQNHIGRCNDSIGRFQKLIAVRDESAKKEKAK